MSMKNRIVFTLACLGLVGAFHAPLGTSPLSRGIRATTGGRSGRNLRSRQTIMASGGKALVVQNKGGGHGELGYHLALKLLEKDVDVTLLQDGNGKNKEKQPFASYGNLEGKGVRIVWGDFSEGVGKLIPEGETFDFVFDNYAKDVATCQDAVESAKAWGVKNYVYVSSGGMYKDSDEVPLIETCPVKETGQRKVEMHLAELGLPWTSFRPQYIYGPLTNKRDYLDWFFDRVVHGLSLVPLPLHGDQFVTLTHAEDVASMLASVVGNEKAVGQVFNCATDRYITYNNLFQQVMKVVDPAPTSGTMAFYYDPEDYDLEKGWFPFRNNHFFVNSDKAKRVLGWSPKHYLLEDLHEYYEGYKAAGKHKSEPDFLQDDEINLSWHHDYMPYMSEKEYLKEFPDAEDELERIKDTFDPQDRHFYSAIMEGVWENHIAENPEAADDEEARKEYEAYMAAHPGLAEQLEREEFEFEKNELLSMLKAKGIDDSPDN